eukprot:SAG25_NODE_107_length_15283_cov_3.516728_6_plen_280_part_00
MISMVVAALAASVRPRAEQITGLGGGEGEAINSRSCPLSLTCAAAAAAAADLLDHTELGLAVGLGERHHAQLLQRPAAAGARAAVGALEAQHRRLARREGAHHHLEGAAPSERATCTAARPLCSLAHLLAFGVEEGVGERRVEAELHSGGRVSPDATSRLAAVLAAAAALTSPKTSTDCFTKTIVASLSMHARAVRGGLRPSITGAPSSAMLGPGQPLRAVTICASVWSCPGLATAVLAFLAPVELAWAGVGRPAAAMLHGCVQYLSQYSHPSQYRNSY